jgi:NlpC/P60 family putative phage cell wall peptidase
MQAPNQQGTLTDCGDRAISRAAIIAEARTWIGTPYRHQASLKGAGADCLGLIRGVWRGIYGDEPELPGPYTPNWAEETASETLRDAARRHLIEIDKREFRAGDVVLIRMRDAGPAKHAAIMSGQATIIHAYDRHAVAENHLPDAWRRRIAYAFSFPGVED